MAINNLDDIVNHIPFYLVEDKDAKRGFIRNLESFPEKINYYTSNYPNHDLQGDGWEGLDVFNIDSREKVSIKGIVLSNSCDISTENTRDYPVNVVFAPIVKLAAYEERLKQAGLSKHKIDSKIASIKKQQVTSIFYLPQLGEFPESIVLFDDIHSLPVAYFQRKKSSQQVNKIFTLSQLGFYLFLFKISVHFCRFHEKVLRDKEQA